MNRTDVRSMLRHDGLVPPDLVVGARIGAR